MGFFARIFALSSICVLATVSFGQSAARTLITETVDEGRLAILKGNTHPLARAEFDRGAAPLELPMNRMLLVLKRSADQETALRTLLDDQQDKASPNYHKWMTPEDFGKQFGPSDQDILQVTTWLQSHGFQIAQVSKGCTVIEFSGTAAQVREALHTTIHKYAVKGKEHWANASDPLIPSALTPVVAGVESLNNFPRKSFLHTTGVISRSKATGEMKPVQPLITIPSSGCGVQTSDCFGVGPYDFATIYNVSALWNASPAIDGTGQAIAIVGETDINPQDVADFRNFFGLPALGPSQLNIIHNGPAPGILADGEETESDLDVEWSSAVAKGATIDFVVSESTETTFGIDLSAQYIIDNNIAPVMSESYGECELGLGTAGNIFYSQLWQQAASEGITVFVSSGDSGAAGCSNQNSPAPAPSQFGLAVSGFASTPYNVAVGGTDFNDLTNASSYWSFTNHTTTQASALSYIPETTWNDSCTNSVLGTLLGFSNNAESNCNNSQLGGSVVTVGGGGGASHCTSSQGQNPASCSGGYPKPSWQTGAGVPQDGVRDIPDVSLFAASGSPSGSFYIICEADQVGGDFNSCNPAFASTQFLGVGGTSASSPAFAGILALVNQQTNSRQGNANYVFYKLAAQQAGVFNDVTTGTIAMPCQTGSPNCTTATAGHFYGVLSGYSAASGYDLATGLGSVNVANLVNKWNTVTFNPSTTTLGVTTAFPITHGQSATVTVTVTSNSGRPTGAVSLLGGPSNALEVDSHVLSNGTATWNTMLLPGGSYNLKAHYAGDGMFGASDSSGVPVVVNKENSSSQVQLITYDSSTGRVLNSNATTAVYGSSYLLRVDILNSAGSACPAAPTLQAGCPTGSVTLFDHSALLGVGAYTLNSLGYLEDQTIQLRGGSRSIQAQYSGDNSFKPNTSPADTITITPASTTMTSPSTGGATVGNTLQTSVTVLSQGSGDAPGGTVTFFANGVPVAGTVSYQASSGTLNGAPSLQANFQSSSSPFTKPGSYIISATYSGDGNYSPVSATAGSMTVKFPQPSVSVGTANYTVAAGSTILLTATVFSSSSTIAPTGTLTLTSPTFGQLPGTPSYSTVTDQNGNLDLQATLPYTINASDSIQAAYSGDSNYPSNSGGSSVITVTGADFNLTEPVGSLTIVKGQSNGLYLDVGMQSGTAPVTFSATPCSGLPAESTCNVAPTTLTYTGVVQVSVATTAPHSAAQKRTAGLLDPGMWIFGFGATTAGILLLGAPLTRRRSHFSASIVSSTIVLIGALVLGIGCGGGSSNNSLGGGSGSVTQTDPGTPAGTYTVTVTATSGTLSHKTTFQLTVQ